MCAQTGSKFSRGVKQQSKPSRSLSNKYLLREAWLRKRMHVNYTGISI